MFDQFYLPFGIYIKAINMLIQLNFVLKILRLKTPFDSYNRIMFGFNVEQSAVSIEQDL